MPLRGARAQDQASQLQHEDAKVPTQREPGINPGVQLCKNKLTFI